MDLWDSLTIMIRRWYVTLPVAVLCAIGTVYFSSLVDPEYVAEGVVFVKGPVVQEVFEAGVVKIEPRNPYLGTGGTDTFARILVEAAGSSATRGEFFDRGFEPTYDLSLDRREAIISVEVRANDPDLAIDTVSEVLSFLGFEAEDRQLSIDDADNLALITIETLSQSGVGEDKAAPRRVFGVLAAASLIVTVGTAFLVEGIIRHLRGDAQNWAVGIEATVAPRALEPLAVSLVSEDGRGAGPSGEDSGVSDSDRSTSRWSRRVEGQ